MTSPRWQQIKEIVDAALKRDPSERARFLDAACPKPGIRKEVDSLLAFEKESFLEKPAAGDFVPPTAPLGEADPQADLIGRTLSHYKILGLIGQGGMGVLYRAVDTQLDREVAIKLLRPEVLGNPERKQRFVQEAKAASAINHPNIITVYEIGRAPLEEVERDFIAMEYVDGKSLSDVVPTNGIPIDEALRYARQIADALSATHERGIVHRDIKPTNIMITEKGQIRVLDFGLAKLVQPSEVDASAPTVSVGLQTEEGAVVGTAAYMSPEQAEGKGVDARSDIFSLGVVLYQMLSGQQPFQGDSYASIRLAILRQTPPPVRSLRPSIPKHLERVVGRCLEKRREDRYSSIVELAEDLAFSAARLQASQSGLRAFARQPRFAIPAAALLVAAVAASVWLGIQTFRKSWARNVALPEIDRLVENEDYLAAFRLAREAHSYLSDDAEMVRMVEASSLPVAMETTPPGADVFLNAYTSPDAEWEYLGKTPLPDARVPLGYLRFRVSKDGFETVEAALQGWLSDVVHFTLPRWGEAPRDMVQVPAGTYRRGNRKAVDLETFWLDKYEVTNQQFQQFVEAGGYQSPQHWKQPFAMGERTVPFEEAVGRFLDATGRVGPATWELGTFPPGEEELPVRGVSWYEAAAYCTFAGKNLPTLYHWTRAAGFDIYSDILSLSNFGADGPAPVGAYQGLGPYGTYDMAGNVKEWCLNRAGAGRYILGGAWNEPLYKFMDEDARPPLERGSNYGFRCAKYVAPLPEQLARSVTPMTHDISETTPVADNVFEIYQSMYAYDRKELNPQTESIEESAQLWRHETVSFDAAYGNQRVIAHLYMPLNAAPPFQAVVYFPGSAAARLSSHESELNFVDFLPRSGRALVYPVYQGTYERRDAGPFPGSLAPAIARGETRAWRDAAVHAFQDLARSIDYLETREDIDHQKLAYLGLSRGATLGPIYTALETRFKASVLLGGGFLPSSIMEQLPGEVNPVHFAPRTRQPILMINGRYDFVVPVESSQLPMLQLLGARKEDKRHALFDAGHLPARNDYIKEILTWLDRYLGPVESGR